MTEFDLQNALTERFKKLNDFSGIKFLKDENVAYPNKTFTKPNDKTWFEVHFMNSKPSGLSVCENRLTRCSGIMQIDICVPLQKGEKEVANKYKWISRLFSRGTVIAGDIMITNVYVANQQTDTDHYRINVRVEWEADIEKE